MILSQLMQNLEIKIEENETKGKVYIGDSKAPMAEMTFSKAGTRLLIIDHTEVGPSLQGQGVGRKLLDEIIKLVRERQLKVIPLCPFAKSVFVKDPSIRDVLRT